MLLAPIPLAQLASEASLIVDGVVRTVVPGILARDELTSEPTVIHQATIDVTRSLKGHPPADEVIVRALGGETPELSMSVASAPVLRAGARVIVLLTKDHGRRFPLPAPEMYVVHGWNRGIFTVEDGVAVPQDEGARPMPLQELLARVAEGDAEPAG